MRDVVSSLCLLMKIQEFAKSREFLSARKRDLVVNNAKRNPRPQAARELTEDEEDLLFQTRQFSVYHDC